MEMKIDIITTIAGVFGIVLSLLILAWDIFFLFVCYQPLVFTDHMIYWLAFFYAQVQEIQFGVNAVVIFSTFINFIWLVSSVGALLSNQFSKSNATGLRIWICVTLVVVFSDIAMTLFIIFANSVTFEDLFRSDKKFLSNFNSTAIDLDIVDISRYADHLDTDVAYRGYWLFIAGISRVFLITIFVNLPLVYLADKRVREIRLNAKPQSKERLSKGSSSNFYDNMAFAGRKTPNMYAETPIEVNEIEDRVSNNRKTLDDKWAQPITRTETFDDKWAEPITRTETFDPVVPNRFRLSQAPQLIHRTESERRSSARNYDLNIDAVPRASPIPHSQTNGSLPNAPAMRVNLMPINRYSNNKIYPDVMPEIPDVDYDDVPDTPPQTPPPPRVMRINGFGYNETPATNPLYATISKPNSKKAHQRSPSTFQTFDRPLSNSNQMKPMNGNGPYPPEFFDYKEQRPGNIGGHRIM